MSLTKVTIILILAASLCQGECPIECFCDVTTICSGDKQLTSLPLFRPLDLLGVNRLELHEFLVTHVQKSTFHSLVANLTEIRIVNNPHLTSFQNDTFVDEGFPTSNLTVASATNATNASIPTSSNSEIMHSLRTLDFSRNNLQWFVAGPKLAKLTQLDLSSNKLQQVYGLQDLRDLESVNLRDNLISFLPGTLFENLANLQYINLDCNKIGRLDPTIFSNLPSLAHVILSSNPIENLLPGFFWNSRVQFVDISRTGISHIPSSVTNSVRDFRCANNNLTRILNSDFESYPNLGILVLDENAIQEIEDDAFGRLEFLTRLWINGNRLTKVPQNLPPSLRSLQLEDNSIADLSLADFSGLTNLEELNLHGNRITSLPPLVFKDLINLRSLDVRSNGIDTIGEKSFGNLCKLEALELSQNPIRVIVNGAFEPLRNLSLLIMSRLEEKDVEFDCTTFNAVSDVKIFDVSDSPGLVAGLLRDDYYLFTNFLSITELSMERSGLEDLQTVCDALVQSPFGAILSKVKLGGNPWQCPTTASSYKTFLQLHKRQVITDVDQMICSSPKGIKVMNAAVNATGPANITNGTSQFYPLSSTPSSSLATTSDKAPTNMTSSQPSDGQTNTTTNVHQQPQHQLVPEITGGKVETRNNKKTTRAQETTTTTTASPLTTPVESPDQSASSTLSSYFLHKQTLVGKNEESHPGATKTNITNPTASNGLEKPNPAYLKSAAGGTDTPNKKKRTQDQTAVETTTSSPSNTVILKTVAISALVCLLSILVLLLISLIFLRYASLWRSKLGPTTVPFQRRQWDDKQLEDSPMMGSTSEGGNCSGYLQDLNFDTGESVKIHRGPTYTRLGGDQDTVELSGITNRLYFENEDIYHIT